MKINRSFFVGTAILMTSACATTSISHVYKDPAFQGPIRKVLVIGVSEKSRFRKVFETEFKNQLFKKGVTAIPSYTVLPAKRSDSAPVQKEVIADIVQNEGADAVIVTRLIDKKTLQTYYPATVRVEREYAPTYTSSGYYDHYAGATYMTYTPGYTVEEEVAMCETSLYNSKTAQLIWNGLTETTIGDLPEKEIAPFVKIIINDMAKRGLLPAPN